MKTKFKHASHPDDSISLSLGQMTLVSVHFYDTRKVADALYFFHISLTYDLIPKTTSENSNWPQDSREIMFLHFAKTCSLPRKETYKAGPQSPFARVPLENGAKHHTLGNYNTLGFLRDQERKIFTQETQIGLQWSHLHIHTH